MTPSDKDHIRDATTDELVREFHDLMGADGMTGDEYTRELGREIIRRGKLAEAEGLR